MAVAQFCRISLKPMSLPPIWTETTFVAPVRERVRSWGVVGTVPRLVVACAVVFAIVYVVFLATTPDEFGNGNWRTTNSGSAIHDPETFTKVLLDAVRTALGGIGKAIPGL